VAALRFDGRVAIVTGAGRGLGREHARLLASRGARVVVNDLGSELSGAGVDDGPAQTVVSEIERDGAQAVASCADVADPAGAQSIVELALERWGRIDIVVNNAGILTMDTFPEMELDVLMRHLAVHVGGTFNVTRAAWPHMASAGYGRVIATTSSALFGAPPLIGYAAAKGALVGLARSLAVQGADAGILVNLLAPAAETRMVTDPGLRARNGLPPLPADAAPDASRGAAEVAPMLAVLAHESCAISGQILSAGGGRLAHIYIAETAGLVAAGLAPEDLVARWDEIIDASHPAVPGSTAEYIAHREARIAQSGGL
jgi:NAD(P)-dependent dehydrogenase (short-subunit alcohol dehydrogenase family)